MNNTLNETSKTGKSGRKKWWMLLLLGVGAFAQQRLRLEPAALRRVQVAVGHQAAVASAALCDFVASCLGSAP